MSKIKIEPSITYVIIGSKNPTKIKAVEKVFNNFNPTPGNCKYKFFSFPVDSEVGSQPIGLDSVTAGALNRAKNALLTFKQKLKKYSKKFDKGKIQIFGVGIEAGLVEIPHTITGFLDFQFCAIIDDKGRKSIAAGPGWQYPPAVINTLMNDPSLEIGDIMAKISENPRIKYESGAIGFYSHGKLDRSSITEIAVATALIPFINSEKYFN